MKFPSFTLIGRNNSDSSRNYSDSSTTTTATDLDIKNDLAAVAAEVAEEAKKRFFTRL